MSRNNPKHLALRTALARIRGAVQGATGGEAEQRFAGSLLLMADTIAAEQLSNQLSGLDTGAGPKELASAIAQLSCCYHAAVYAACAHPELRELCLAQDAFHRSAVDCDLIDDGLDPIFGAQP